MKIIDLLWNGKKQFRFTYTGGDWKRDNEIQDIIVNNENKSSRVIGVEYYNFFSERSGMFSFNI